MPPFFPSQGTRASNSPSPRNGSFQLPLPSSRLESIRIDSTRLESILAKKNPPRGRATPSATKPLDEATRRRQNPERANHFNSPEGAGHFSPGQRPGLKPKDKLSPEGAAQFRAGLPHATPSKFTRAFSAQFFSIPLPGALPRAEMTRAFSAPRPQPTHPDRNRPTPMVVDGCHQLSPVVKKISTRGRATPSATRAFFSAISHQPLAILLLTAALLLAAGCSKEKPRPALLQNLEPPAFTHADATNAFTLLEEFLRLHPSRDAGTSNALAAAQWIHAQLFAAHDQPGTPDLIPLQSFSVQGPHGELKMHNVASLLQATQPATDTPTVFLLSHYDTKSGIPGFVGANDSGSSTALLLTLHRILAKSPASSIRARFNVAFAFLDGEECEVNYGPHDGLHGSRRLAAQCKEENANIRAVILLDMVGDADLSLQLPANCTPDLRVKALEAATKAGTRAHVRLTPGAVLDDHVPFLQAGFPAVNFIDFEYGSAPSKNDYWHTAQDTLDKLSPESLYITARTVLQLMADLAAAEEP